MRFPRAPRVAHERVAARVHAQRDVAGVDSHQLARGGWSGEQRADQSYECGNSEHETCQRSPDFLACHSHSIVEGGLELMSSATRFTPGISLMIRLEIVSSRSYGRRAQSAVIASSEVTARITIG